ncbi:MAG: eCIS core domain-containing protein [bacterium]
MQRKRSDATDDATHGDEGVADVAGRGVAGTGSPLPHLDRIQASFGRHDVSGVQAHHGAAAATATHELGAKAYAFGDAVAFGGSPDLHTAAHEAAHVVQQRGGVHLKGGIDQPGDDYERHADAVADRVTAGQSAESLLDQMAGGSGEAAADPTAPRRPIGAETPGAEADAHAVAGSAEARPRGGTKAAPGIVSSSRDFALQRSPANAKRAGQQEPEALRKELGLSITTSPELGGSNTAYVGGQIRFGLAFTKPPKTHKVQATSWSLEIPGGGGFSQVPSGPTTMLPINHVGRHRFVVVIEVDDATSFEIKHEFDAILPCNFSE